MSKQPSEIEELPFLTQANYLGQGFDITGTYRIPDSLIVPIIDGTKVEWKEFEFLGKTYAIPAYVEAALESEGKYSGTVASTREEIQNSFAAKAEIALGYGAFSGAMNVAFDRSLASSTEYDYGYRNLYQRLMLMKLNRNEAREALAKEFVERYEELPTKVEEATLGEFEAFFYDYGMYVTSMVALGGSLEYSSAIAKSSEASLTSIKASLEAEYRGLLVTGEFSASLTNTEEWKRYAKNRTVKTTARGGDPSLLAPLTDIDPNAPSTSLVKTYEAWLKSLSAAPAVADFTLIGIWELIPNKAKREAVREAFPALQGKLRPRLVVQASPEPGWPPTITLGKTIRPKEPPSKPAGFQMVMLDRDNLANVTFDRYYAVAKDAAYKDYLAMYDEIARDIEEGFDNPDRVIVLAGFGISVNGPPDAKLYSLLRSFGAGSTLTFWKQKAQAGKNMERRATYVLVGIGSMGPGTGLELLSSPTHVEMSELEALFSRQRGVTPYSMSAGSSKAGTSAGAEGASEDSVGLYESYAVAGPEQAYAEDDDQ